MDKHFRRPRNEFVLITVVIHLLALALPLALLQVYDRIIPSQSYGTTWFLVIGVGVAILLEATLRYGRMSLFARLAAHYEVNTQVSALEGLLHSDVREVEKRGTPAIIDAFRSIGKVRDFWSGQASVALYETPFVLLYMMLIAYIGGWLVLIPLALFVLAALLIAIWSRHVAQAAQQVDNADELRTALAWSCLNGLADIKSTGAQGRIGAHYRKLNATFMRHSAHMDTLSGWIRENAQSLNQLGTVLLVAWGAVSVIEGHLTTGALAACTMLVGRSIGPVMSSLSYWAQLSRMRVAQSKVDDLLSLAKQGKGSDARQRQSADMGGEAGILRIEAPTLFTTPVEIKQGELVAIKASDGQIASHLLMCIAGLCQDEAIHLRLDGRPVTELSRGEHGASVALVTRRLALVPGSILTNLTLFDPRLNSRVPQYCDALGLDPYLGKLRHGLMTEIGGLGAEHLNEGVYQRIALIRALVRKPRILLLDHAASGLDLDGVKRLVQVLTSLQGETTVLLVSNKPSLVDACTRQLELQSEEVPQ